MPYLQLDAQRFSLDSGDTIIGTGDDAHVRLEGAKGSGRAVVGRLAGEQMAIRRGSPDAVIFVNGVQLGAEPLPLIHGDKVEIGGRELFFGDDRKAGSTQVITGAGADAAGAEGVRRAGQPSRPAASTGGRLVSLVDGKEYVVPPAGLVIGRDATCDVVVPSSAVSRKHAVITPREDGYLLTDVSTNGLLINNVRPAEPRLLARGDVIRIGDEDFRFYADAAPAQRMVLATLEVSSEGVLKGRRYEIRTPLSHVGRGPHNDVVLPDESVSDAHAKLQRREAGWVLVDMGSTNGTYVAGRRVQGEQRIDGAADLRFGGVKMHFRPGGVDAAADTKGTRRFVPAGGAMSTGASPSAAAGAGPSAPSRRPIQRSTAPARIPPAGETPGAGMPIAMWLLIILALLGLVTLFLYLGR